MKNCKNCNNDILKCIFLNNTTPKYIQMQDRHVEFETLSHFTDKNVCCPHCRIEKYNKIQYLEEYVDEQHLSRAHTQFAISSLTQCLANL